MNSVIAASQRQMPGIRIDVTDLETGDTESQTVTDDVVVITAGRHYVHSVNKHANGTQTWTIKRAADDHEASPAS